MFVVFYFVCARFEMNTESTKVNPLEYIFVQSHNCSICENVLFLYLGIC